MEVQCSWTYSSSCWAQRSCSIVFLLGRHLGGVTGMCLVYLCCSWGEGQGLWLESRYALLPALMKTVNIGFFEAGGEIVLYAEFSLEVELQILSKLVFEPNLFHGIDVMIFFFLFPLFSPLWTQGLLFSAIEFSAMSPFATVNSRNVFSWCVRLIPYGSWLLKVCSFLSLTVGSESCAEQQHLC